MSGTFMPNVFITQHYHLTLHCIDDDNDEDSDDNSAEDDDNWGNNLRYYRKRVDEYYRLQHNQIN